MRNSGRNISKREFKKNETIQDIRIKERDRTLNSNEKKCLLRTKKIKECIRKSNKQKRVKQMRNRSAIKNRDINEHTVEKAQAGQEEKIEECQGQMKINEGRKTPYSSGREGHGIVAYF